MAHNLEIAPDGVASFVYNGQNGRPWHHLGTPVDGLQDTAIMLRAAHADYDVWTEPVYVKDERTGEFVAIKDRFATVRHNPFTDALQPFEVFTDRYTVMQNEDVLGKALDIVGASEGDAVIETLGVLFDGRQFFATIDLGSLIIDPAGVHDEIARYIVVKTSHDGTSPVVYANTDIRVVCNNTLRLAEREARATFKARHTPNAEGRLKEAQVVLGLSTSWAKSFEAMANDLLTIEIPQSSKRFNDVMEILRPSADADTDRKKKNRDEFIGSVRAIYANDRNAGAVGHNGWGLLNAITEFYDWHRNGSAAELATASLDEAGLLARRKREAQEAILATV